MGVVIAWEVCEIISEHILNPKSRLNLERIQEVQVKRVFPQVIQTNRFELYLGI
ncbi:uncharacterized protein G2W53_010413 [Senna tora]|uniref:Uncharacterized protein n=1 Tax=Senna tora TaxID=362788 RepID=A0A834WZV6_9FABA|nr:uncharacterized protein G2W53_010413 [Senna tora]